VTIVVFKREGFVAIDHNFYCFLVRQKAACFLRDEQHIALVGQEPSSSGVVRAAEEGTEGDVQS
jgi:hypothetical protein